MNKPVIAIVGRPNVGKSTLFNKLIGKRLSIVDDTPALPATESTVTWNGAANTLCLLIPAVLNQSQTLYVYLLRRQAQLAIDTANVIILVTDCRTGMVATDMDVANMLQKSGKPVIVCVNKCDSTGEPPAEYYEFYNLGFGRSCSGFSWFTATARETCSTELLNVSILMRTKMRRKMLST